MPSQAGALRNPRFQNGVLACMATRTVEACKGKAAQSNWWLLLIIGVGTLLSVVALKLAALFGAAVNLSFLRDVGQNVDMPAAVGAGGAALAGGAGGKDGGPLGFKFFAPLSGLGFLHSEPSTGSPTTGSPPYGGRFTYNDVRYDASGNATWYHMTPPSNPGGGWAPASDLQSTRPTDTYRPGGNPQIQLGPGEHIVSGTMAYTTSARG